MTQTEILEVAGFALIMITGITALMLATFLLV